MKKFIIKRLGLALISLFLLSLTIFLLMRSRERFERTTLQVPSPD